MKFGDLLQGTITRFDAKGRGVFDFERPGAPMRPVAVPFATIGDTIEAKFIKRDKVTFVADLVRVITSGPDRVAVPVALDCYPGALWMPIDYDAQIRFKRDMINAAFADAGHDERVETVTPSSVLAHFRNRMDYAVSWDSKIGLKEFGSWNRYRDVTEDPLLSDTTPRILEVFRQLIHKGDLQPWDNVKYHGDLRYVVIREGKNTGDRVIAPIVKDLSRVTEETKKFLRQELSGLCTSLVIGENPLITDLSIAQKVETLIGDATLTEIVNDTTYHIHLNSFFQTNSIMSATLQDVVADLILHQLVAPTKGAPPQPVIPTEVASLGLQKSNLTGDRAEGPLLYEVASTRRGPSAPPPETPPFLLNLRGGVGRDDGLSDVSSLHILDLYCGLGFFGINLTKRHPNIRISGFEIDAQAIELAKENAQTNNVADRCDFTSGPAEDLSWKDIPADVVILDPPRAGLHPRVITTLLEKKPQTIIYVSCNYHRLVEELKQFKTAYNIDAIQAVDMFPHTPHVEVITRMVLM